MDDIERAIIYLFDESGATPPALKKQAADFCEQLKRVPDCWQLCLQRIGSSSYDGVRFWCLSTLQDHLRAHYIGMGAGERIAVKQRLTSWLRSPLGDNGAVLPTFLRNKVAQLVVFIVQVEFPEQWPHFFTDLAAMTGEGPLAIDMFCRVLTAVDQDVVSLEIQRTPAEIQRSMALKDALRESCIKVVADACIRLAASLGATDAELAAAVLEALARYVNWIDIGLVANDRFVPLLFSMLESGSERLQASAAEVLTEIVSKRMDAEAKLQLVQQLGLAPVAAAWRAGLPGDADGDLPLHAARLLAALCNEVLDSWKKVENAVVSLSSVGLAVDGGAAAEARQAVAAAKALLAELLPAALAAVRWPEDDVRGTVLPFLQAYVNRLRGAAKRGEQLPEEQTQHVQAILEAVAHALRCPESAPPIEPPDGAAAADDDASGLAERRQELLVLLRNTLKLAQLRAVGFLRRQLEDGLRPTATFVDVEAAVTLLFEAGEGANEEMAKPGCGALGELALALMRSEVPHANHRLVALALMECYARYHRVLAKNPEVLSRVLTFFLSDNGMGHADTGVEARACYLLSRLLKTVRSSLTPLLGDLLTALQPHLSRIMTTPRPEPPSATKTPSGLSSTTDDRLYAHEAAGLLAGSEDLPEAQQLACLGVLMQPLLAQIESNLPAAAARGMANGAGGSGESHAADLASALVLQALEGLSRLSRGLTLQLCTVKRPAVGESLAAPLEAALRIPQAAPSNRAFRARVISFLHRLVECLGRRLLPRLPGALAALMPPATDRADLIEISQLLTQLATRYKGLLEPLMNSVLPEFVRRVHALMPPDWDWVGSSSGSSAATIPGSEEAREAAELQRAFFGLLLCVTGNGMTPALLGMESALLDSVLHALLAAAAANAEPPTRRCCFQVLSKIVAEIGSSGSPPPGYQEFLMRLGGPVAIGGTLNSGLDVRDAAVNALLGEVAALLQLLTKQAGSPLTDRIASDVLPPLALPAELQKQLLVGMTSSDAKSLKAALRAILQHAAPPAKRRSKSETVGASSPSETGMMM